MAAMRAKGEAIDLVTLMHALGDNLERVGGPAYLASLTDGVARSTNVGHYGQIVVVGFGCETVAISTPLPRGSVALWDQKRDQSRDHPPIRSSHRITQPARYLLVRFGGAARI
jgi:DnaB helicase-like protein